MYRGIFRLDFIGMTDELFVLEGGNGRNGRQEIVERAANFRHASLVLCRVERNAGFAGVAGPRTFNCLWKI